MDIGHFTFSGYLSLHSLFSYCRSSTIYRYNNLRKARVFGLFTIALCLSLTPGSSGECLRRRVAIIIKHGNCLPKRMLSFACQGTCPSYTQVSLTGPSMVERSCQCCQELKPVVRQASIMCPKPNEPRHFRWVVLRLAVPRGCMCRPCNAPKEVQPQEFSNLESQRSKRVVSLFGYKD